MLSFSLLCSYTCTLLADLRMDTNRFFVIYDAITRLKGLLHTLLYRFFQTLSHRISSSGLKILHCQHTYVSSLPVGVHDLSLLEELQAHHCRLQTIDGRLGLLHHLRVLNCSSNPVWSPPEDTLALDTPELKRVLAALALTQPAHAVSSHIMCVPHRRCF